MNNTFQILLNWDKGHIFSERMAAKILTVELYEDIDPQSPGGGPDGKKDMLCVKDNKKYLAACYFPLGQKEYKDIKTKFESDYEGATKNNAEGFIFITNQKITPEQRIELVANHKLEIVIYHGERTCGILDSPKGYGIRLEYLGTEVSKEEQMSFLDFYTNPRKVFEEEISELKRVTTRLEGEINDRDKQKNPLLSTFPIAGIKFSSAITIEDLFSIHKVISDQEKNGQKTSGFRQVEVWVGQPGKGKSEAVLIPPPPSEVGEKMYELIKWWRGEYEKNFYSSDENKIAVIAEFHSKFLAIHPFLDGNGRVARAIASLQFKDLLNKDVEFEKIDQVTYYKALRNADEGGINELSALLTSLMI